MKGIDLILKNNNFIFNQENFIQTKGTAMGTRFAPSYATLVLGYLEIKLEQILKEKFGKNIAEKIIEKYRRYLDDVFLIWNTENGSLEIFHNILNELHADIKFTNDCSGNKINFLDVELEIKQNYIITDVYYKKTDSWQYLDFKSNHPRHIKTNIPYNLARRLCMIINNTEILNKRLNELKNVLLNRNYPEKLIENGINKAKNIQKEILLKDNIENKEENIIPLIQTYNPNYQNQFSNAKNAIISLSHTNPKIKNVKFIKSYRQPKNLKRILTQEKKQPEKSPGVEKCNNKRCKICEIIITKNNFNFKGEVFKIKHTMDCTVKNCIYVLQCNGCKEYYIGETSDFRFRMNNHLSHIKNNIGLDVSKHVNRCTRDITKKISIMPIYKVLREDEFYRKAMEHYFIEKFKPKLNKS